VFRVTQDNWKWYRSIDHIGLRLLIGVRSVVICSYLVPFPRYSETSVFDAPIAVTPLEFHQQLWRHKLDYTGVDVALMA